VCGIDLVRAGRTQQGLDVRDVVEDPLALVDRLAVIVRRPELDPAKKDVGGRAQEHDSIAALEEPALVRHRSRHVQGRLLLTVEQAANEFLVPHVSACLLRPPTPRGDVGLDNREARPRKFRERRRLSRA